MASFVTGIVSSNFVKDYGDYSLDFPLVNPDGGSHWSIPLYIITGMIGLIGGGVLSFSNYKKPEEKNKIFQTRILFFLGLFLVTIGVVLGLTGGVKYLSYLGQWNDWYGSLPNEGKSSYQQMKMVSGVMNELTRMRND